MKKFAFLLTLGLALTVSAGEKNILDYKFADAKLGNGCFPGWFKNHWNHPQIGKAKVVAGRKAGEKAFKVSTLNKKIITNFYSKSYAVTAGQKLILSVQAQGKGQFQIGYYAYDAKGKWLGSKRSQAMTLSAAVKYQCELPITDFKKDKIAQIRLAFWTLPETDVTYYQFNAKLK